MANALAVSAIVPAAGRAERFGGGKLLADLRGEPLLQHTVRSLLDGGVERIVVVIAVGADFSRVRLMSDERVETVENPDPSRGMFSSIQTGIRGAATGTILVLPADMPFVRPETIARVRAEGLTESRVVVPAYLGRRGHPIAIPERFRGGLLAADPAGSLRDALVRLGAEIATLDVDDEGILRDVDVRQDLDKGTH